MKIGSDFDVTLDFDQNLNQKKLSITNLSHNED